MSYKVHTGGQKEFVYTKEDIARIERDESGAHKETKEALRNWYAKKDRDKLKKISPMDSKDIVFSLILFLGLPVIVLLEVLLFQYFLNPLTGFWNWLLAIVAPIILWIILIFASLSKDE